MIAYLILAHRYPQQFKRLFKSIYHPDNVYMIHVDKRSGPELYIEIKNFLSEFQNAKLLKSKSTIWGGYSLVDAELRGIKALLKMGKKWDFFINLSAQDFPLKSQKFIQKFLKKNLGKDFLKVANQPEFRPDTLHRIENYVTETDNEIVSDPKKNRAFLSNVIPQIGNQWMILCRKFCEFLSDNPEVDRFKSFYKHTLIADEGFFQTVIMNTSYKPTLINDDKRAIEWIPMGTIKLRPKDFTITDAPFLLASPHLFARKFDETLDSKILDFLEEKILN